MKLISAVNQINNLALAACKAFMDVTLEAVRKEKEDAED